MQKNCDLHMHSIFSDGSDSPSILIDIALREELLGIALTDHNTVAGLYEFTEYAKGKNIVAVPGTELTTGYNGEEVHMVALFVKPEHYESVMGLVKKYNGYRLENNRLLVNNLSNDGFDLDWDAIISSSPTGEINRLHIAKALVSRGYAPSVSAAFDTILSPGGKYYRAPKRLDTLEAIDFIRSIGALPIMAHPFLSFGEKEMREFLPIAKEHGLVGFETRYSLYSPETDALASRLAKEFDLLESGGSDYHGSGKPDIRIGHGKGGLEVPGRFLEDLMKLL